MPRYFIQVAYNGAGYAGFQIQENANSIQAELQKAMHIFFKANFELTCSSRTDTGVHALSNFFHFDADIDAEKLLNSIYSINSILPKDIVVKKIFSVSANAHCRFDAISREYEYFVYQSKNPFIEDRAFYYPYKLNIDLLQQAASLVKEYTDFTTFSKKNTQVKTFNCTIIKSEWQKTDDCLVYIVKANRFLRGMVRGLTGTMLRVGTEKITIDDFKKIIESKDCTQADFSVPPHGLFLKEVLFEYL